VIKHVIKKRNGKKRIPEVKVKEKANHLCHKCGGSNHFAKKCRILKHLVELYQRSIKKFNTKRSYEFYFNNETKDAITSGTIPSNLKMSKLANNDDMDMVNTIVEYNSNDVFGDLK
jgi:hypothetical protein